MANISNDLSRGLNKEWVNGKRCLKSLVCVQSSKSKAQSFVKHFRNSLLVLSKLLYGFFFCLSFYFLICYTKYANVQCINRWFSVLPKGFPLFVYAQTFHSSVFTNGWGELAQVEETSVASLEELHDRETKGKSLQLLYTQWNETWYFLLRHARSWLFVEVLVKYL